MATQLYFRIPAYSHSDGLVCDLMAFNGALLATPFDRRRAKMLSVQDLACQRVQTDLDGASSPLSVESPYYFQHL